MGNIDLSNICVFDCETTGIPRKGQKWETDFMTFPNIVQIAWSFNGKERNYIIYPKNWIIPPETVKIHGITTERALREGVQFSEIIDEFLDDCNNAYLLIGHNIYFDTSIIKAMILRVMGREYYEEKAEKALFKGKRIDTMKSTIKFVGARYPNGKPNKYPKLDELYTKLFPGESFEAHNAIEDVRALFKCVKPLVELGIIELKQKIYDEANKNGEQKNS